MSAKDALQLCLTGPPLALLKREKGRLDLLIPLLAAAQSVDEIRLAQSKRLRSKARGALRLVVLIKPGGSGLGLPTTAKIIEAHGGAITVQS